MTVSPMASRTNVHDWLSGSYSSADLLWRAGAGGGGGGHSRMRAIAQGWVRRKRRRWWR